METLSKNQRRKQTLEVMASTHWYEVLQNAPSFFPSNIVPVVDEVLPYDPEHIEPAKDDQ